MVPARIRGTLPYSLGDKYDPADCKERYACVGKFEPTSPINDADDGE